jgi:hypothetical protein
MLPACTNYGVELFLIRPQNSWVNSAAAGSEQVIANIAEHHTPVVVGEGLLGLRKLQTTRDTY